MGNSAFSGGGGGGGGGNSNFPWDNFNFKSYGADPTGVNDSTTALQAYIDAKINDVQNGSLITPSGGTAVVPDIVLPPGHFKISAPLNLSGTVGTFGKIGLRGAPGATEIFGNYNGYLITKSNTGVGVGPSYIKDIHFTQRDLTAWDNAGGGGGCLDIQAVQGLYIKNCSFAVGGGVCINFNRTGRNNIFGCHIDSCLFTSTVSLAANTTAIGIILHGQTSITGCDFTLFSEALRIANATYDISGNRFEVNKTAFNIGRDAFNVLSSVSDIAIAGIGFEANDICFNLQAANNWSIQSCEAVAESSSPSGNGANGVLIGNSVGNGVMMSSLFHGGYTNNAIQVNSNAVTFIDVQCANNLNSNTWVLQTVVPPQNFIGCTYTSGITVFPFVGTGQTNAIVASSYTVLRSDWGRSLTFSNTASVGVTLPQPGTVDPLDGKTKQFMDGWTANFVNLGTGLLTITPTSATIDGGTNIQMRQFESTEIWSDGTNYYTAGHSGRAFGVTLTPSALTGDVNDYNPTGLNSCFTVRQDGGASNRNITGLSGGRGARVIRIVNIGANNLVLKNQSASSASANRFLLTGDWTLTPNQVACVQYDNVSNFWRPYQGGP